MATARCAPVFHPKMVSGHEKGKKKGASRLYSRIIIQATRRAMESGTHVMARFPSTLAAELNTVMP